MTTSLLPVAPRGAYLRGASVALSAALAIAGALLGVPLLLFLFKPLTTGLVLAHAWTRGRPSPAFRRWILIGLALSLVGDVALLWPDKGFLPGLVSFLLAHLAYIAAFTRDTRFAVRPAVFAGYALVAGVVLAMLWHGVPMPLRAPVVVYVLCLASMAAQAGARWRADAADRLKRSAALGGALFMTSDALLATDRFAQALPAAPLLILATYWAAQWCMASSLPDEGSPPSGA